MQAVFPTTLNPNRINKWAVLKNFESGASHVFAEGIMNRKTKEAFAYVSKRFASEIASSGSSISDSDKGEIKTSIIHISPTRTRNWHRGTGTEETRLERGLASRWSNRFLFLREFFGSETLAKAREAWHDFLNIGRLNRWNEKAD